MAQQRPNAALVEYLNNFNADLIGERQRIVSRSVISNAYVTRLAGAVGGSLRLHHTPLSLDTVSVIARMLSDPSQPATPIASLEYVLAAHCSPHEQHFERLSLIRLLYSAQFGRRISQRHGIECID